MSFNNDTVQATLSKALTIGVYTIRVLTHIIQQASNRHTIVPAELFDILWMSEVRQEVEVAGFPMR
jgi:hypothetical protein